MRVIDWVNCVIGIYLAASVVYKVKRGIYLPISMQLLMMFILPYVFPVIYYLLELFPNKILDAALISVYNLFFTWEVVSIVVVSWAFLAFLTGRVLKLRIFVKKHRKALWGLGYTMAFVLIYAKYTTYPKKSIGICEVPEPFEYFSKVNLAEPPSDLWPIFVSLLISLILCISSCVFCCLFYTPIKIA